MKKKTFEKDTNLEPECFQKCNAWLSNYDKEVQQIQSETTFIVNGQYLSYMKQSYGIF